MTAENDYRPPPSRSWLVELDGRPLAPDHPLMMDEAAELWKFYARRPGAFVEIKCVMDQVAQLA